MTTINVTAEHIAKGVPGSCTRCAVALAISDAFPGTDIWVYGDTFDLTFEDFGPNFVNLPAGVDDLIHALDDRVPVEPFTFTVDYPVVTA
jgi:hypothetical protein